MPKVDRHNLYSGPYSMPLFRYARKSTELRDRLAQLSLQIEACDRGRAEYGELAEKVFELSQSLTEKWLSADPRARRRLLEIVCLNYRLDDVILVPEMRKPFDVLAEGLLLKKMSGRQDLNRASILTQALKAIAIAISARGIALQ